MTQAENRRVWLLAGTAVAALLTIVAYQVDGERAQLALFTRPLTTALLLLLAATTQNPLTPAYRVWVCAGLVSSLVGDGLLMLSDDRFLPGLAALLIAHTAYTAAFAGRARFLEHKVAVLGYVVVATALLALVLPAVGGTIRAVIIIYILSVAVMAAQGASWMLSTEFSRPALFAAVGAALLVASGAMLAIDQFVTVVPSRNVLVLGTYWLAQAGITLSVQQPPPPTLRM